MLSKWPDRELLASNSIYPTLDLNWEGFFLGGGGKKLPLSIFNSIFSPRLGYFKPSIPTGAQLLVLCMSVLTPNSLRLAGSKFFPPYSQGEKKTELGLNQGHLRC